MYTTVSDSDRRRQIEPVTVRDYRCREVNSRKEPAKIQNDYATCATKERVRSHPKHPTLVKLDCDVGWRTDMLRASSRTGQIGSGYRATASGVAFRCACFTATCMKSLTHDTSLSVSSIRFSSRASDPKSTNKQLGICEVSVAAWARR